MRDAAVRNLFPPIKKRFDLNAGSVTQRVTRFIHVDARITRQPPPDGQYQLSAFGIFAGSLKSLAWVPFVYQVCKKNNSKPCKEYVVCEKKKDFVPIRLTI
jgi:hypothetical protein